MSQKPVNRTPQKSKSGDIGKWILIWALLIAGLTANYYYYHTAWGIRAAIGIVYFIILLGLALTTNKGKKAAEFFKGARIELRKVTWPTRPETVQSTVAVMAMIIATSIVLWGLDSILMWAVRWLTGQRG